MKPLRLALSIFLVIFGASAASAAQPQRDEIVIGLIPEMNVFQQMERFRPLSKHLSEQTGRTVRFTVLTQ